MAAVGYGHTIPGASMSFFRSRRTYLALVLLALGAGIFAFGFYASFLRGLPSFERLENYRPPLTSVVLDRNGKPIGEFYLESRRLVPFEQIPRSVVLAFVAGEDATFFEHKGLDYVSILRAAWVNLRAGGAVRQGGSTITQQVAKSLLSSERSIRRKIKDMLLARRIEKQLSKQEILYLYLNQIYLGSGSYGVAEATRRYFGKDLSQITLSEAATLAGLPKAPSSYSPIHHPERAEQRRRYVLEQMLANGFIDQASYDDALAETITLARPPEYQDYEVARYFTEEVRRYLSERLGDEALLGGGLKIETTIDIDLQRKAIEAVRKGLEDLDRRIGYRGPQRRVATEQIEATILALGAENHLLPETPPAEEDAASGRENETALEEENLTPVHATPRASSLTELPVGSPLLGVVTEVDAAADRATVAFAPGIDRPLLLETVSWARTPNPKQLPTPVKSIAKIVQVGDVATFILRPVESEEPSTNEATQPPIPTVLDLYQIPEVQGSLLSFEVANGNVLAFVGGYDYNTNQFIRVTQAYRQPGSAIKPLIYAAALANGFTPASIINDTAVVYTNADGSIWKPKNYTPYFHGPVTLREALVHSYNTATIRLFRDVGTENVIRYMRRLGITSPLNRDLSLALGTNPLTLLELTRAYAVFPAGGRRVTPRFITRVTDRDGNLLVEDVSLSDVAAAQREGSLANGAGETDATVIDEVPTPSPDTDPATTDGVETEASETQIIPETSAYLAVDLVRAVVTDAGGTGWRARKLGRPVAGKTGTTNQQADAWFVGFSPDVVTGVWVGFDKERVLGRGETGSRAASPIWVDFMAAALDYYPDRDFPIPPGITFARIDRATGLLTSGANESSYFEAFVEGTEPTETVEQASPVRPDLF